jgi:hypothetical protein
MKDFNYTTPEAYVNVLVWELLKAQTNAELLTFMMPLLNAKAVIIYGEYITGERESPFFNVEDIETIHSQAISDMAQAALISLIDKDLVQTVIGEDGDLAYQLTDNGKELAKRMRHE